MRIDIVTLFPSMFVGPFDTSMLKKAKDLGLVEINIHDLRKWAKDRRKSVDDRPYGGGVGMVLMVEPIDAMLSELRTKDSRVILLTPQGATYNQAKARELVAQKHIIIIAGHYEGFDQRIHEHLVDEQISIGDYILTGGEIPAMAITDSLVRLIPGVLEEEATTHESFSIEDQLDFPVFTRPEDYKGWRVPEVLLGGNHKEIEKWRQEKAQDLTRSKQQ